MRLRKLRQSVPLQHVCSRAPDAETAGIPFDWERITEHEGVPFGASNASRIFFRGMSGLSGNSGQFDELLQREPLPRVLVVAGAGAWPEAALDIGEFVEALAEMLRGLAKLQARRATDLPHGAVLLLRRVAVSALHRQAAGGDEQPAEACGASGVSGRAVVRYARAGRGAPTGGVAVQRAQAARCDTNRMMSPVVAEDARVLMHLLCVVADEPRQQQPQR